MPRQRKHDRQPCCCSHSQQAVVGSRLPNHKTRAQPVVLWLEHVPNTEQRHSRGRRAGVVEACGRKMKAFRAFGNAFTPFVVESCARHTVQHVSFPTTRDAARHATVACSCHKNAMWHQCIHTICPVLFVKVSVSLPLLRMLDIPKRG